MDDLPSRYILFIFVFITNFCPNYNLVPRGEQELFIVDKFYLGFVALRNAWGVNELPQSEFLVFGRSFPNFKVFNDDLFILKLDVSNCFK